jgi:hypothetical protein
MFGTPGELTIQPGETQVYTQTTNYPLSFSSNPNRVQYRLAGGKTFEFINADPIQLVVTNKWPFAIKLSADNYMESEPLDIEKNSQVNSVIYTNSPRFKIEEVPGYTTKASYSTNNGIMYVVID